MPDPMQPLSGRRIVVTRAGEVGQRFAGQLRDLGAIPIVCPAIRILPPSDPAPLDAALAALDSYDWLVCTSANAVTALLEHLSATRGDASRPRKVRIGAVGTATAAALIAAGWQPDCVPTIQTADVLAEALGDVAGCRILFPASAIARPTLADKLRARGATVTVVTAYRTVAAPPEQIDALTTQLRAGTIDAITFASPSTVHSFVPVLANAKLQQHRPAIVCIGPVTAAAVREAGLAVTATAAIHSAAGLLGALNAHFAAAQLRELGAAHTNEGARSCSI